MERTKPDKYYGTVATKPGNSIRTCSALSKNSCLKQNKTRLEQCLTELYLIKHDKILSQMVLHLATHSNLEC